MKPQVSALFSAQYGTEESVVEKTQEGFYNHSFQRQKSIRIVALDDNKVIGFQSLFYWPYQKDGVQYNSLQSGNSLVHPEYRGKGIFQSLLNFLDDYNKDLKIDFLVGFPVEASFKSFLKNKWSNPFDLVWQMKIINPLGFLFSSKGVTEGFDKSPQSLIQKVPENTFRLLKDPDFENWLSSFRDLKQYSYFNFTDNGDKISFSLKVNKRSRWFNELIIGDIKSSTDDLSFIEKGLSKLIRRAFLSYRITAITIAVNEFSSSSVNKVLNKKGFFKTNKKIHFITKTFNKAGIDVPENWELYRSDIDTW